MSSIMPADVAIYTTPWCPYCHRAKALLSGKKIRFEEIDVDTRPDLRRWLSEATRQRTVPQVFINNRPVGGFTDIAALEQKGELDALLSEAPPPDLPPLPR
ncbi:glutaredoxin 3 [Polyangium sp. 15x6]|uniref:glutaredoxin 3 n=1 Tax=Polyangium sp. 15x6 TaxID=3042687 RepID=UPI00249B995C|nr:glutaredoxin 3 [Polyangium sp. 15x6]MDI3287095.1 glutaredoxin 3 [Polyangium sp. 15x6]